MTKRATREALGTTLVELHNENPDLYYAVDADLAGSTTTAELAKIDPTHHFDVGVAEQNMIGVAAGLALADKVVFTGSFAAFGTGRCYDQIRNTVCYGKLNVKLCPTHAGISVGPDGGSHQMLEDIGLMRGLPNMRVIVPADYESARSAIKMVADKKGPYYVRLGRAKVPQVYEPGVKMTPGGSHVLRKGSDVTLIACGVEVNEALIAADMLEKEGISAEVIDVYSIKPIDTVTILTSAFKTGVVVTCEEHSVNNGLGSAVAELLAEHHPTIMARIGVWDTFGTSGEFEELMEHFEMHAEAIVDAAKMLLSTPTP